jgi:Ca2+-binding RTX toxin-like protein
MDATRRLRLSLLLSAPALVLAPLLAPGPAPAAAGESSCSFAGGEVRIDGRAVSVRRDGSRLVFREAGEGALDCTGGQPTVENTDRVRISMINGTIYESVQLDQRGGRLSASGVEYELRFTNANNGDEGASVEVVGGERRQRIAIGRVGNEAALDLRAGGGSSDPDVEIRARKGLDLAVVGGKGDDTIDASGSVLETGDGALGNDVAELRLYGRGGADVLHGSGADDVVIGGGDIDVADGQGGNDRVKGGADADTMLGGAGEDVLLARDGLEDLLVDCGAGDEDEAKADPADAGVTTGCETVKAPGP